MAILQICEANTLEGLNRQGRELCFKALAQFLVMCSTSVKASMDSSPQVGHDRVKVRQQSSVAICGGLSESIWTLPTQRLKLKEHC
jgi:hypothetical protein